MTVSGQFTLDGVAEANAEVRVIDLDTTPATHLGVTMTDSNGEWSFDPGYDATLACLLEYEDSSGNQYNAWSKPYIQHSTLPSYIANKGVLWLPFDEGSGSTAVDELGNGHDANITGAVWESGTWVGDTTLYYDGGATDISKVPHHTDLNVSNGDFAIAATLNSTMATSTFHGIAIKYVEGATETPHYGLILWTNSGDYGFRVRDSGGTSADLRDPISNHTLPIRLVGVRSGDTYSLYIDNTQVASTTVTLGDTSNTSDLNIGRYATSAAIDGHVDDVIVFNDALTASEVADDYARQPWS